MSSYLERLTIRLAEGLARQADDFRTRQQNYLRRCQNPDGGFSGREGGSDLYYTAFGLRSLAVLDALTAETCERAADYLRSCLTRRASVVDFYSLLYGCLLVQAGGGPDVLADSPADWPERVADTLESFRTADGGYGKTPGATSASTYHTFLVGLCYELLGRPWPKPETVSRFLESRQREDGGFVEVGAMKRSGTNPTAAAVGAWHLLHGIDKLLPHQERVVDFLVRMASAEGGFRANDRIPLADLLSTFTAVWTLNQLGELQRVNTQEVTRYALALEMPGGGFKAGLWDERSDVEYTFYGLGTVALCPMANL